MTEALRWYFLAFFAIGIVVLLVKVIPEGRRPAAVESRATGPWAQVSVLLLPLQWVVPPCLIVMRAGELAAEWYAVRALGVLLSLYAAALLLWAPAVMGRLLIPYAAILEGHELVTTGPFRFVRHPIYSGNLALFLGAALGTLNAALLALWPVAVAGFATHARVEERLLRERFGPAFEAYARRTGLLVPRPPSPCRASS